MYETYTLTGIKEVLAEKHAKWFAALTDDAAPRGRARDLKDEMNWIIQNWAGQNYKSFVKLRDYIDGLTSAAYGKDN